MKTKSYHHYCDCAHPCMSFSEKNKKKNSFKTGNVISKEFVKWKQKGKWINPFCELGLTEDQNVYRNLQRGVGIPVEFAGKQKRILPSWNTL